MPASETQASILGAISISARDWQQVQSEDPGGGLTTVFLQGTDNAYDIQIKNISFPYETFYQYWYVWTVDSGVDQNDTLFTEIYGTFEMGGGNDTMTASVAQQLAPPSPAQLPYFLGGPGDDVISATGASLNAIAAYGGSGDDSINATPFDDLLYGDEVDYFYLWPTINGFIPAPYSGTDGDDTIAGFDGNDTIIGGGGNNILSGGDGNDSIAASAGSNQLFGGDGSDTVTGGTGSDFLYGGPRGTGYLDILSGGGGADIFMLSYTEAANDGSGFWGKFFEADVSTITGGSVKTGLANIFKDGSEAIGTGFVAAALGGVGEVLVTGFLSWIESLGPVVTPQEDVLVVRDFDPSQDVLVLPTAPGVDLSEPAPMPFNPDAAGDFWMGLEFADNNTQKVYAEVTLSTDFLASVGLTQQDSDDITRILNFVRSNKTRIEANTGNLTSLSNLSAYMSDGGFTPPQGAQLPTGTDVVMFGAVGGLIYHSEPGEYANSFIVGTQYADVLTINPVIQDPSTLENNATDFTTTQSEVHGLGGDDIIYGGAGADILRGGDGNDLLYSFLAGGLGEDLSGGNGNDTILGGGSFGIFDGGAGSDTFGVFYGNVLAPMQLFVDLIAGIAGERAAPSDPSPPVGSNPPFSPAADHTYTLTGFENVIGGSLNDWIRAAAGGTVEGAAGADYIDATAGGVTLSYAGSAEGVTVQLFVNDALTRGGDAAGDVFQYAGAYPAGLIGSPNADVLGGISTGAFTFTGLGGADLFQILAITPSSQVANYTITDFTQADGDLIDLRLIGGTASNTQFGSDYLLVSDPAGSSTTIKVSLANFTGTLNVADVLFAASVSGAGRADAAGGALSGGGGDDILVGQSGEDFLFGNNGSDVIAGLAGADLVDGGRGNDHLRGDDGGDRLLGGDGADTINGGTGDDTIHAGRDGDRVIAGTGNDRVDAGAGNDSVWGEAGDDLIAGWAGDDRLLGGAGRDTMTGQGGQDSLFGGDGNDFLFGHAGNDLLVGGRDADRLYGGAGNDTIEGGAGRDIIDGGAGADLMRGGADADVFRLAMGNINGDTILGFDAAEGDRLLVLGVRPVGVSDLGGGLFAFTDGSTTETAHVFGATVADFHLLIG
ncbi:hypothetical protein AAFN86_10240 [Roseomonas sp. CAU 1739]|uniref:hypothetical protein n=1 Tax=Roseomonas sp. CAU 1739 TaxID=3140364 RepID=UPI00325B1619